VAGIPPGAPLLFKSFKDGLFGNHSSMGDAVSGFVAVNATP
jgi:hypothetical protein